MEETLNEKKIQPNNRESQENSNVRVPIPCKISNEPSVNHTIRNAIDVLDNQNSNRQKKKHCQMEAKRNAHYSNKNMNKTNCFCAKYMYLVWIQLEY